MIVSMQFLEIIFEKAFPIISILRMAPMKSGYIRWCCSTRARNYPRIKLKQQSEWRPLPQFIRVDNGPEFIAGHWRNECRKRGTLNFIPRGQP